METSNIPVPNRPQYQQPPVPIIPEKRIGRFRASYLLTTESFELLRKDKEVMLFPLLSALFCSVLCIAMIVGLIVSGNVEALAAEEPVQSDAAAYAWGFGVYLVIFFIATYFQAGLTAVVHTRILGGNASFSDGIRAANSILGKIIVWSLVASTVGLILQIIFDRSKLLGKIVIWLLGAAWGVLTFFMVPVLLIDKASVGASLKKSAFIFKQTWGETLIMNFSMGLYFFFVHLFLIVLYVSALAGLNTMELLTAGPTIALTAIFVFAFLFTVLLQNALNAIFKVVLFEYASTGRVPEGFEPQLILGAIKRK